MRRIQVIISIIALFGFSKAYSQCGALYGTPQGAYPVCGDITLTQPAFAPCSGGHEIWVKGCSNNPHIPHNYQDINPTWYSFTCYKTGTFGLRITPDISGDNYDWELFDVTNRARDIVYRMKEGQFMEVFVSANWAKEPVETGASEDGDILIGCYHPDAPRNPFTKWPVIIEGHQYLLLVCRTEGDGGYKIKFGGGTADITDPSFPHLVSASTTCSGTPLRFKFNKKLRCSSLSPDDFSLVPNNGTVTAIRKLGCDNSFETDSGYLTLSNQLPPGNYQLKIKRGADGNTGLDFCDKEVPDGESVSFSVPQVDPPKLDSIVPPACSPTEIWIVLKHPVFCSTISPDGSQFTITGPQPVSITHTQGFCAPGPDGVGDKIRLTLADPITKKGTYKLTYGTGSDGYQLQNECLMTMADGLFKTFQIMDTVNADFQYVVKLGCGVDTISFTHDGNNEINMWNWQFEDGFISSLQNPTRIYNEFGLKHVQLIVSNGGCSDTAAADIPLNNTLKAGFETLDLVCPGQLVAFRDTSRGNYVSRLWEFGNGNTSASVTPPQQSYPTPPVNRIVQAKLTLRNSLGCTSIATKNITLADFCQVHIPSAFTPNRDGLNDYLYPLNLFQSNNYHFIVYDHYGEVVFESRNVSERWNGKFKGQTADPGTYIWVLQFTDPNSGRVIEQRGTSVLLR